MRFFLTLNEQGEAGFTPAFRLDKLVGGERFLKIPLPLGTVQLMLSRVQYLQRRSLMNLLGKSKAELTKSFLLKALNEQNWSLPKIRKEDFISASELSPKAVDSKRDEFLAFNQFVTGRQLSEGDLRILARELRQTEDTILKFAQANVESGKAEWVPAVATNGGGFICRRCGERNLEEWPGYYGRTAACNSCKALGTCTSQEVLYRDFQPLLKRPVVVNFKPHRELTEAQRLASDQVLDFLRVSSAERALLWAACGSGKTEVCFSGAVWALDQGKSVLFAAPRQDVIHDVAPRMKRAFLGLEVQVLTGSSLVKFQTGGLVLATTHQVLRFWQAFDVIFLDEMDAFPYHGSERLKWGLDNALRPDGKLLALTATPSAAELREVQRGRVNLIQLPARHHRLSLPAPEVVLSKHSFDPKDIPQPDKPLFLRLREKGPVLVFIPKISWLQPWIKQFRLAFPRWNIDGSYSADPERADKISRLRQGEFDLFVSTTILERGITLDQIQAVVLAADHPVFDERALVQMAGRVGRTSEHPEGYVIYLAQTQTPAMKTAISWIKEQNRLARQQGLID